jgi:quinohemoprotein ethanol dehydrogenase
LSATPLEIGGTLYFSGSFSAVYAVDAAAGKPLWRYDPHENERAPREMRRVWATNRGVAFWNDMVYVATRDCRMIALDAKTGAVKWSSSFQVPESNATSTGAPRIVRGKVIIGNSGAEFGARGYVTAFDATTSKLAWRFFTVPGDPAKGFENDAMAMAAKTWSGDWWKHGGGGTPWNAITFDEDLNDRPADAGRFMGWG